MLWANPHREFIPIPKMAVRFCRHDERAGVTTPPTRSPGSLSAVATEPSDGPRFRAPQGISLWAGLFDEGTRLRVGMALACSRSRRRATDFPALISIERTSTLAVHSLFATPATIIWGRFSAAQKPVLTVQPGDTVIIETFNGLGSAFPPENSGMHVAPAHRAIVEMPTPEGRPGHLLTGPVAIAGAEPGDVLEVRIEAVDLSSDWGFNGLSPLAGTLAGDFMLSKRTLTHIPVDQKARTARLPSGITLALAPFLGVMGVAPPDYFGEIASIEPRIHGGNIDNRLLGAGSTLFLPVWAKGALFSCGDGHGIQGDGEVCINGLEMGLTGTFTFVLHKATSMTLSYPRAETADHLISMGFHADLDQALVIALREMIGIIGERTKLTPTEAYQLCSLVVDFAITQSVNGEKGVHGKIAKALLATA
jgi:acetamidase/formamidase